MKVGVWGSGLAICFTAGDLNLEVAVTNVGEGTG